MSDTQTISGSRSLVRFVLSEKQRRFARKLSAFRKRSTSRLSNSGVIRGTLVLGGLRKEFNKGLHASDAVPKTSVYKELDESHRSTPFLTTVAMSVWQLDLESSYTLPYTVEFYT